MDDLPVIGTIPQELDGTWHIVGSNPQFDPIEADRYHWFEGDGMVCAITLQNGKVNVATRWVEAEALLAERKAKRALFRPMINGSTPTLPVPGMDPVKNPANTNVIVIGDRLLVFAELDLPHELDRLTMSTLGKYDFEGINGAVTAHGKLDPKTGEFLFYGCRGPELVWYLANAQGKVLEQHAFATDQLYMVHDFAVTADYAIFFTGPTVFDPAGAGAGTPLLVWEEDVPATIWLYDRRLKTVRKIVLPDRFAVTHFLNAWHDGDEIVVQGNRTDQWGPKRSEMSDPLRPGYFFPAFPWEWRISLKTDAVVDRQVSTVNSEFPRHDPRLVGEPTRYAYYAATDTGTFGTQTLFDRSMKLDVTTGEATFAKPDGLTAPSETIFVPRSQSGAEDDGWTLTLWWNPATTNTEIVIQDAQRFGIDEPVARVALPFRQPLGFHGNWHPRS